MRLQGTMRPHQIISLLDLGANTLALGDHDDHIHVGFHPLFGANKKLGKQALAVLKPGQWSDLLDRLRKIDNPVVPTKPSKYAIPVRKAPQRRQLRRTGASSATARPLRLRPARVRLPPRAAGRPLPDSRRARRGRPSGPRAAHARRPRAAAAAGPPRPRRRGGRAGAGAHVPGHADPRRTPFGSRERGRGAGWRALQGDDDVRRGRARRGHAAAQRGRCTPSAWPPRTRTCPRPTRTRRWPCASATAPASRWPTAATPRPGSCRRAPARGPSARWRRRRSASRRSSAAASGLLACEELVLRARSDLDARPPPRGRPPGPGGARGAARRAAGDGPARDQREARGRAANAALRGELPEETVAGLAGRGGAWRPR